MEIQIYYTLLMRKRADEQLQNLPTVFFEVRQYCLIFLSSIAILLPRFFQPHTFLVKMHPFFVAPFSLLHKKKKGKTIIFDAKTCPERSQKRGCVYLVTFEIQFFK